MSKSAQQFELFPSLWPGKCAETHNRKTHKTHKRTKKRTGAHKNGPVWRGPLVFFKMEHRPKLAIPSEKEVIQLGKLPDFKSAHHPLLAADGRALGEKFKRQHVRLIRFPAIDRLAKRSARA